MIVPILDLAKDYFGIWATDAAVSFTVAFEFEDDSVRSRVRVVPQWANPAWQWMDKHATAEYQHA